MPDFRSTTVTNTSTNISTSGADVKALGITNKHSAAIFVRFYNQTIATFQDTPARTFQIAANAQLNLVNQNTPIFSTTRGLCVRVVTDAADNGNTAAATLPVIELTY